MPSLATKPVLVLIHGAWHTPDNLVKLTQALRASDFEVHTPRLLSVNGARPPNADLSTDTDLVRSYVSSLVEAGRNVVVIMHSYGGQVGTNALHGLSAKSRSATGLKGGVTHLIYLCAFALPESGTMAAKIDEFGHGDLVPLTFDIAEDGTMQPRDPKAIFLGEDLGESNEKEVGEYLGKLVLWNGACPRMPVTAPVAAWREIPVAYVYCTKDMTVPFDYQKSMVALMEKEGTKVRTFTLETGHIPNLTATKDVVRIVEEVVG
ncbi:Alpha/beta hydrolase fold-1 [Podospora australis]|uniref:Alpha/beta hydrolase fold-1 n=1 Tax=Podospora australis TaxID=1536484 RepID=A0AAN6WWX3_9PEZI|nr:Alpha/beta hydrolase fold-1 [Podospora australis]